MGKSKKFEELIVWQKAHQLFLKVYKATSKYPKEELFCLESQYRRAAVSVPAIIAEGYAKTGIRDKLKYYNIAQGSLNECFNYNILSKDLNYFIDAEAENLMEETGKLLHHI